MENSKFDLYRKRKITRVEGEEVQEIEDLVIKEYSLTITLNGQEIVTLVCSPRNLDELAIGYLFSEEFIRDRKDLKEIKIDSEQGIIAIQTVGGSLRHPPGGLKSFKGSSSGISYGSPEELLSSNGVNLRGYSLNDVSEYPVLNYKMVFKFVEKLHNLSSVFKKTGGVHNSLLADTSGKGVVFREDIGRHNTIDKLIGHLVLYGIFPEDKVIVLSGRISSEILLKTARARIPLMVSAAAPTEQAIQLAEKLGITLIGFVRAKKMNIYTHSERIEY